MGAEHGKRAVVGAALQELGGQVAAARAAAEGEQLDLLPPSRFEPGTVEHDRLVAAVRRDRAGRPDGAQNKATRDIKDFCRRVFGFDPMLRGFQRATHTPETLAVELGCTRLEAYDRLADLEKDLRRYFYAPMQPIGEDGKPVPFFQLIMGGQHAHVAGGEGVPPWLDPATGRPWGAPAETQQNQRVIEAAADVSHGEASHEGEE